MNKNKMQTNKIMYKNANKKFTENIQLYNLSLCKLTAKHNISYNMQNMNTK